MYLRYPLSYQDMADLQGERGVDVDRSTVFRWVQKFGSELAIRAERHPRRASLNWQVDETYIRVGGKWRYPLPAIDKDGQLIDVRLHRTEPICNDKAPTYRKVIRDDKSPVWSTFWLHHPYRQKVSKQPGWKRSCCAHEVTRLPTKFPIIKKCEGNIARNGNHQNNQEWPYSKQTDRCPSEGRVRSPAVCFGYKNQCAIHLLKCDTSKSSPQG